MTPIVQPLLTVAFGAIAGGVTNALAIWMLFHPYEPPRIGRWRLRGLQGAIPKNKDRLARAMGRTVGMQLLTPGDMANALDRPELRDAFEARLGTLIEEFLGRNRGALSEELPPALAGELRRLLDDVAASLLERLQTYLAGEEFRATAGRWVETLAEELRDRPLGELLTAERSAAFSDAAERWLADAVQSPGFERAVGEYLERASERLLEPGRTFEAILPISLVATVEKAVAGYLPLAIERLGGLLEDPGARAKAQRVLHEVLDRFMRDLRFHQRLVAALVITPETIDKVLRAVETEGAGKIAELLQDPDVRGAMARSVNDAVVDFLRRPVRSVLGDPEDETVSSTRETVKRWALDLARDPHTSQFLVEKLRATMAAAEERTWADLFRHLPPDRVADALVAAARSERAATFYRDAARGLADRLLDRPMGRPADHLPADAAHRLQHAIAAPLWTSVLEQVPAIVERIDIARRVEEKIMDFPPQRVEDLIRGVTERELKLIVRLGYVLGAMIGLVSAGIALLLH